MQSPSSGGVCRTYGDGRWFPGRGDELRGMVDDFLDAADVPPHDGRVVAALAPHAGFIYSGAVAGHTFRAVRDDAASGNTPDTVVIVGFTHRERFAGVALLDGDAVVTPMGESRLDRDAAALLAGSDPCIEFSSAPHAGEHSAENEIPFVQAALPDVPLVVALMGDHSEGVVTALTCALRALAESRRILLIASTDMLHNPDYELVTRTDHATLRVLESMDIDALRESWSASHQPVCGVGPVSVALDFARSSGAKRGTTLCYRNSGDDHPESRGDWVVGYCAVAFIARDA